MLKTISRKFDFFSLCFFFAFFFISFFKSQKIEHPVVVSETCMQYFFLSELVYVFFFLLEAFDFVPHFWDALYCIFPSIVRF